MRTTTHFLPLLATCLLVTLLSSGSTLAADRGPISVKDALGNPAARADDAKPDKVFTEAMRSQDPHLLTASGQRYENGVGVAQDVDKALKLYCRAAGMGDVDAQYRLGHIHAHGRGVKRDPELAAAWFAEAIKGRHVLAATQLKLLKVKAEPKRKASCAPAGGVDTRIVLRPAADGEA